MKEKSDRIFVQIPCYRDSQIVHTIESLLTNAHSRTRLDISICWQHINSEKLPGWILRNKQIQIINIDAEKSKGANWARSIIQKEWNQQPYTFLVDSHTRFVRNWDKILVDMILILKKDKVKKPIVSGYPPYFWDPLSYPRNRLNYPLKMYPLGYENNLLTKFNGLPLPLYKWLKKPIKAEFIALGFLFAEGKFNLEIPFDPNIYFFGDDITTGLRAYSHGYNFFHPHRLVAWHLYDRKTRVPHWDDHENWRSMNKKSYDRIYRIFKGESFRGFAVGKERTISDYERYINYKLIANEAS